MKDKISIRKIFALTAVLLAAILILNISLFYRDIIRYDVSYYNLGVVTKISARSKGSDEILLKLNYLLPSGGYSVCNVDENDGEYIGDGKIEYGGSLGKYRIMVEFGDVGMSGETLTEFLAHDSLKDLPIEIKAKQACPSDHGFVLYIGSDSPISVEPSSGNLNPLKGAIRISIKLGA